MNSIEQIKEFSKKEARYTTAIESLNELLEKDNEIEPVKHLKQYFEEQRRHVQRVQNNQINDIPVTGATYL